MKSDSRLQHDVLDELKWQPTVDASQVNVNASNGVVTLTGLVPRYANKMEAERIAKRVLGVRAITNDIEIELSPADERTDGEIAHSAANAFTWHTWIPQDDIEVIVHKGWVTLKGTVDWQYQRTSAQEAISQLDGVRGISNLVGLTIKPQPIDIADKIESAFKRCAEVDASHVRVKTTANTVVLEGSVSSPLELAEADRVAWAAPGVTKVDNRLTISE
jgi:osmotically-inducible protein OsmY